MGNKEKGFKKEEIQRLGREKPHKENAWGKERDKSKPKQNNNLIE